MENDSNITDLNASDLFALLPLIYLMMPFIWLYYWITGKDIDTYIEYRDEPKEVLQMRYAKGEINSLEYLERMARL